MACIGEAGAKRSVPVKRSRVLVCALVLLLGARASVADPGADAEEARPGWGLRLLYYVPNRLVDLVDIFRARLRIGPGLAVGLRVTDYGAFYIGDYNGMYLGLPGPRVPRHHRWPVGVEELRGIVIGGVDATDNTLWGPEYAPTEVTAGAHLLLVGADVGIDPLEFADFLSGLVFCDLVGDDYPRRPDGGVRLTSGVSVGPGAGAFAVAPKPDSFMSWSERLNYLETNVHLRVSNPIKATDQYFATDGLPRLSTPDVRSRLGIYASTVQGADSEVNFDPDFRVEVDLPNLERRLKLFIENTQENILPGRDLSEQDDEGLRIGARRWNKRYNIRTDLGVRARWPPEAFARIEWRPDWSAGPWRFAPRQRLFYETDDGFGEMTSLAVSRWFGPGQRNTAASSTSGKWTTEEEVFEWEQTFSFGHVIALLDERDRGRGAAWHDTTRFLGARYSCFGADSILTEHRVVFGYRWPLYRHWIFGDIGPGVEWKNVNDWDMSFRLNIGIDMLFWGVQSR